MQLNKGTSVKITGKISSPNANDKGIENGDE